MAENWTEEFKQEVARVAQLADPDCPACHGSARVPQYNSEEVWGYIRDIYVGDDWCHCVEKHLPVWTPGDLDATMDDISF